MCNCLSGLLTNYLTISRAVQQSFIPFAITNIAIRAYIATNYYIKHVPRWLSIKTNSRKPSPVLPHRPSSKLDFKRLGRFKITQKIYSYAYKLDLPTSMKCHPVFHVSLLEPAANNPLAGEKQPAPPPIIVDHNVEFEVEELLDSKLVWETLKYLVCWVGYDQLTCERAELLKNSHELFHYFYRKYPTKPKPNYLAELWPDLRFSHPEPTTIRLSSLTRRMNLRFRQSSPLKRGLLLWTLPYQYLNTWCYYS